MSVESDLVEEKNMAITVFSLDEDLVIKSQFVTAKTTYSFAIENFVPLIDKLDIQRKIQDSKFYRRLEKDLVKGCIMPPLTLAFIVDEIHFLSSEEAEQYISENIQDAFILDGIQRLNTLERTMQNSNALNLDRPMFLNIIFCNSMDNLLYRMITLNNGQKPMTARHQIEILASNIYDFNNLPLDMQTEKERRKKIIKGSFNKADVIEAYIAFLSDMVNIDDQRIIEQKLDEMISEKILNSNITDDNLEFSEIISFVNVLCDNPGVLEWFRVKNNFIGFAVGVRRSYDQIKDITSEEFLFAKDIFEKAFSSFNLSKIKLGLFRRKSVAYFIENLISFMKMDENEALATLSLVIS